MPWNLYLSPLKSAWEPLAVLSHLVGPGGLLSDLQPSAPSSGYGSSRCGPWWWQCANPQFEQRPIPPKGPVLLYSPPETAPRQRMYVQGVVIWPPLQPLTLLLKHTSWAEIGRFFSPSVLMHTRSDAASAPANAQPVRKP